MGLQFTQLLVVSLSLCGLRLFVRNGGVVMVRYVFGKMVTAMHRYRLVKYTSIFLFLLLTPFLVSVMLLFPIIVVTE